MARAMAILAVCFCGLMHAQSAINAPQFEVASIKPIGASNDGYSSSGIKTGHGRLDAVNVTLKRCIMGAYGIGPHELSGGPDWINSERFMIAAKAEQPIDDDGALMVMLQNLLVERFKLVIHRETRTMQAFVLEVGKNGPKLEKAEGGPAETNTSNGKGSVSIEARNTDLPAFAQRLAREMELPVVNQTGLPGIYNFKLRWTPENSKALIDGTAEWPSIFTAIQEQLGLRLHSQKAPVEVLVIDHVEKPSEN